MQEGEYAVHYSSFSGDAHSGPYCTVLEDLPSAVAYAEQQIAARPTLRCAIYDHHGLAGRPVRELQGTAFKAPSDITPRFRRWVGSILFFGGLALFIVDWSHEFRFVWPSMVGSRILIPGLVLLFTEAMVMLHTELNRRKHSQGQEAP